MHQAMVAVILSSNAASISVKTPQASVFAAAKTLLDHVSSSLIALRDSLSEQFSPEAEELLLAALQRTSAFDCQTQATTNTFMLEDLEPFRVFSQLLKMLHSVSAGFQSAGVHLSTALQVRELSLFIRIPVSPFVEFQARANRENSERLSERMAASSSSLVLQVL